MGVAGSALLPSARRTEGEMDERIASMAAILEEAERAHAAISARTGGVDPEWPMFYAWWLRGWSDLPEILGTTPTMSALVHELVRLDRAARRDPGGTPWPERYARELLAIDWGA